MGAILHATSVDGLGHGRWLRAANTFCRTNWHFQLQTRFIRGGRNGRELTHASIIRSFILEASSCCRHLSRICDVCGPFFFPETGLYKGREHMVSRNCFSFRHPSAIADGVPRALSNILVKNVKRTRNFASVLL